MPSRRVNPLAAQAFPEEAWHALRREVVELRHDLHRHPDLSGSEHGTAARIRGFLAGQGLAPDAERIGGAGLLYRIRGMREGGPTVLLRADLDALPLVEGSAAPHASATKGRHHACGHDGHSAMLAGALALLARAGAPFAGSVIALFQPAEEVGDGMAACLRDPALAELRVDCALALHNLPGAPLGTLIVPRGPAAAASTGLRIRLEGKRAHASEPHLARNPIPLLAELASVVQQAPARLPFGRAGLATLVGIRAGEDAFGSSPDEGILNAVMRADTQEDLDALVAHVREQTLRRAQAAGVAASVDLVEPFPATVNDDRAHARASRAARAAGVTVHVPPRPFPWSEDFGHASRRWPSVLAGLGAGEAHPALHSAAYDFPDALLDAGARFWWAVATTSD